MGVSATEGSDVPATSEPRPSGATAALLEQLRLHQDQLSLMAEWLPQLVWTTRAAVTARGMGGELSVTSEIRKGSTFTLTLPTA